MKMLRHFICRAVFFAVAVLPAAGAQEGGAFVAEDIRLEGLRRFSPGAVFSNLPVTIGDTVTPEHTVEIINTLYETGFFRSIDVLRDGNVLVIRVDENPTIAEVTVAGAGELPDEALTSLLTDIGIAKGKVYSRTVVDEAARVIEQAYIEKNFYTARVSAVISPLPRNRVAVLFDVSEGAAAAVRSIEIVGNEVFSGWRLRRLMRLETRGPFNFFGDAYLYSQAKLDADLARIRTLYLEEGYLNIEIDSASAEVSPDKKHIDIVIHLTEGERYVISGALLRLAEGAPPPPFDLDILRAHIIQQAGDLYNGRDAGDVVANMREELGERGYAAANVSFTPDIDDETGMVNVVYTVNPGPVVYVRRIDIIGNEFTADEVIRRELLQFERERFSTGKISRSRSRIRRLGYFDSVNIETRPVEGSDEVDLLVVVDEANTGEVRFGAGFGTAGATFKAGFTNKNIFGTGNDFSADVGIDEDSLDVDLELEERYHTKDGVTRRIVATYGEEESSADTSSYKISGFRGSYGYVWPFTDDGTYDLNLGYERVNIDDAGAGLTTVTTTVGGEAETMTIRSDYRRFVDRHGDKYDTLLLRGGLTYDTRDSASLATEGQRVRIRAEVSPPLLELRYYYLSYLHNYYHTWENFPGEPVMRLKLGAGYGDAYGDGEYPFYRRFLLGGTETLRGFDTNSIGYALDASNDAIGGRSRLYASMEFSVDADFFIFEEQQVFLVPFIDAGAVGEDIGLGSFRVSWGLEFRWRSPIGPLRFSYVEALRSDPSDDVETFQFSVSTF